MLQESALLHCSCFLIVKKHRKHMFHLWRSVRQTCMLHYIHLTDALSPFPLVIGALTYIGLMVLLQHCNNDKPGHFLSLTCPLPVSGSAWRLVDLPALLKAVSKCQHASSTQGVCNQKITALKKWPPEEPYPDQKLFTGLGKHVVVWTTESTLSSAEEKIYLHIFFSPKRQHKEKQLVILEAHFNPWLSRWSTKHFRHIADM